MDDPGFQTQRERSKLVKKQARSGETIGQSWDLPSNKFVFAAHLSDIHKSLSRCGMSTPSPSCRQTLQTRSNPSCRSILLVSYQLRRRYLTLASGLLQQRSSFPPPPPPPPPTPALGSVGRTQCFLSPPACTIYGSLRTPGAHPVSAPAMVSSSSARRHAVSAFPRSKTEPIMQSFRSNARRYIVEASPRRLTKRKPRAGIIHYVATQCTSF